MRTITEAPAAPRGTARDFRTAELPEGELVPIEFTPQDPGEYGFLCGMGMLHGKLIVR